MSSDLETVIEMESQDRAHASDNNDDTLNTLYKKHCLLSIPKDEITRIQHAVETMVRFLLILMYENTSFSKLVDSDKAIKRTVSSFKMSPNIQYAFNDENLLKVGSYYENTKNHYPDEFDFICVIAECEKSDYIFMKDLTSAIADVFHTCLEMVVSKLLLAGTCIEFVKYVCLHGPAAKLEFHYKASNSSVDKRSIFVDISPASKVFTQSTVPSEINDVILYPEWKEIVRATGSFLLLKVFSTGHPKHETKTKVSITESEQYYILEKMSDKHKRVYKILKFLLSNDSAGEDLRELTRNKENQTSVVCCRVFYPRVVYDFPSYVIKTMMFHHCHDCEGSSESVSGCVLSILNDILEKVKSEQKHKGWLPFRFQIQRSSISVSVKTITGEMIEIADSYDSSLKIKKYLEDIRNDISENQGTELIPLAKKMVPVVHNNSKKRKNRKTCVRCASKRCVCVVLILLVCAPLLGFRVTIESVQRRMCWNGTEYNGHVNYTPSVYLNTSDLNWLDPTGMPIVDQGKSSTVMTNETTYCLEYHNVVLHGNRAHTSVAIVNKLLYCGDRGICNIEDKMYRIKVAKRGIEQQLVCSAREFASRIESDYLLTDNNSSQDNMESTGRHLACMQAQTAACMNMKEKFYVFGILYSETAVGCDKKENCLNIFPKEMVNLGCYISQQINENNGAMQTETCCCDRHACVDPEKDEKERILGTVFAISVLVTVFAIVVLCWFGCCCLCAHLEYCIHSGNTRQRCQCHSRSTGLCCADK